MQYIKIDIDTIFDSPVKLDATDRKLLYALSLNARAPLSQLAKDVRVSKQVILYRIKNLIEKGVIISFIPIIQIDKLGLNVYRALFRIENASLEKEQEILNYFYNNKNVIWLSSVGGRWDILVDFAAEDAHSFSELVRQSIEHFPDNLKKYDTMTFVDSHFFKRKYLLEKSHVKEVAYLGAVRQKEKIDETENSILKSLSENVRKTNSEIAAGLNLSPHTVKKKILQLEKKGIIQAYSAFIRPTVFGAYCAKVVLYLREISQDVEKKLFAFAKEEPNIVYMERVLARWNYELDIECYNEKEFRHLLRRLKDTFSDVLIDYEIIQYYYDHKVNYLSWLW